MAGRKFKLATLVLAAWGGGLFPQAIAQNWGGPGAGYPPGYSPPGAMPPGMAGGMGIPGAMNNPDLPQQQYVGGESMGYPPGGAYPMGNCPPGAGYPGGNCPPGGVVPAGYCPPQECAPPHRPWWDIKLLVAPPLMKPPRGTYFRTEYLLWDITDPEPVTVGETNNAGQNAAPGFTDLGNPLRDTPNPLFPLLDPINPTIPFGFDDVPVTVPTTSDLSVRDNNGLRMTLGIPLMTYGTVEMSGFALERGHDEKVQFVPPPPAGNLGNIVTADNTQVLNFFALPVTSIIGIPVTVDGATGPDFRVIGFDTSYTQQYKTDTWGTDAKFVIDALTPDGPGLKLRPLFGVKYLSFDEEFNQFGVSRTPLGINNSEIRSETTNSLFGGTVGVRTELVHQWFTVGVQPSVTFARNFASVEASSVRFFSQEDPFNSDKQDFDTFSPILEGVAYARINLRENLRFHFGYDALFLSKIYRPTRTIRYDVTTRDAAPPVSNITTRRVTEGVSLEGISAGLEFVF